MSERTGDITHPEYRWTDHERSVYLKQQQAAAPTGETLSPGMLGKFDQERNKEWWEQHRMPPEPGLQPSQIDPVDIIISGVTGGGSLLNRGGRILYETGKGMVRDKIDEWFNSPNKN